MAAIKVIESPRLYVSSDVASDLASHLHSPYLKSRAEEVLRDADWLVRRQPLKEGSGTSYQNVTRAMDSHFQCLTCAWVLTRDARYRKAAIKHLAGLLAFNHISCEANSGIPADVDLPFCLSYGELSCTVGLMYDLFRPELTDAEQQVFFAVLDKFLMKAALACLEQPPWWANKEWSNWNGVCAGGMGVMALAFYSDLPDAKKLIPFVENSLGEYFKSYIKNGGGCHEGTGYWNYGMNYAMRYVLSWEHATGKTHPALKIKEIGKSLYFPLDFTGVTFGDNDRWGPTCFYFMLAKRLHLRNAAMHAAAYVIKPVDIKTKRKGLRAAGGDLLYAADCIPTSAEMAKLKTEHEKQKVPVARIYKGMDWAALADDAAFPSLRMAIRGGSSTVSGHGMLDLLSFRCRVNGELIITDQQDGAYMPTTFTRRGSELYGRSVASKSSLFVDGLGCAANVACDKTEIVKDEDLLGIRVDGSHIFLPRWEKLFVGRLFLMVNNSYWLLIDSVVPPGKLDKHWLESRFHTLAEWKRGKDWVSLKSGKERVQMTFASMGPGVIQESLGMPSQPTMKQTSIFRWMDMEAVHDNLHVTALCPGSKRIKLSLRKEKRGYSIDAVEPDGNVRTIRVSARLKLK